MHTSRVNNGSRVSELTYLGECLLAPNRPKSMLCTVTDEMKFELGISHDERYGEGAASMVCPHETPLV